MIDARDKQFAKAGASILRGAALLAGTQVKLHLVEEKLGPVTLVGYRVAKEFLNRPENRNNPLSYITSPCFAAVGDQFVVCSTMELGREMVVLLRKEAAERAKPDARCRRKLASTQAAPQDCCSAAEDQLISQAILDQAVAPPEAKEQIKKTIDWVSGLGQLRFEAHYGDHDFRLIRYSTDAAGENSQRRSPGEAQKQFQSEGAAEPPAGTRKVATREFDHVKSRSYLGMAAVPADC